MTCCGRPLTPTNGQLVCGKCGAWFQGGNR